MNGARLRVTLEPDYAAALGLALYCFATLEWNAVWCCERMEARSIEALEDRTAGRVADTLIHLSGRLPASADQADLNEAAERFRTLVATRNNLVHAKPGTDQHGKQALFRHGDQWTEAELADVADQFTACSMRLNRAARPPQGLMVQSFRPA